MIHITVVGFGNVGSVLSVMLLNAFEGISLNVMDPDPNREGAFLDLAHGMSLYNNREFHVNDEELFNAADFIFYTAGTPNKHGGSRLSTAKENIALTKQIFQGRFFKKEPYVIVITNPVDIVTHRVYEYTNLPENKVIGTGTLLDSVRLSYYLSELTSTHPDDYNAMVLGEHGDSQFAVYSHTKYKEKLVEEMTMFTPDILEEAEILTRNAAFQIRETQKGTTYGVAKCAVKILEALLNDVIHVYPLTLRTTEHYMRLLALDFPIHISMPAKISAEGIFVLEDINFSQSELESYRKSAAILSDIIL